MGFILAKSLPGNPSLLALIGAGSGVLGSVVDSLLSCEREDMIKK